ncbi:unnamed protein product [Prunus armeniaca]
MIHKWATLVQEIPQHVRSKTRTERMLKGHLVFYKHNEDEQDDYTCGDSNDDLVDPYKLRRALARIYDGSKN